MGVVYRAVHEPSGRPVVVKLLLSDDPRPEQRQRFEREALAAAGVAHVNLVRTLDAGLERDQPFIVLELVPGGSLAARLEQRGPLPWREAAALGAGIARGLGALHAAGLVHRDLKPHNVLLAEDGTPKVCDLGLVRAGGAPGGGLTRTGELLGTIEYMSPEQGEGKREVDARSDLYALGATLHALVAGAPPFSGGGFAALAKLFTEPPPRLSSLAPDVDRRFEALVLRLLAKGPADRPASAGDVARELDALLAAPAPRGPPALLGAGLALGLVALVAAAVLAMRRAPPPATEAPPRTERPPAPTERPTPPAERPPARAAFEARARVLVDERWTLPGWALACATTRRGEVVASSFRGGLAVFDAEGRVTRAFDLAEDAAAVRLDACGDRVLALLDGSARPGLATFDLGTPGPLRPVGPATRWAAAALVPPDGARALVLSPAGLVGCSLASGEVDTTPILVRAPVDAWDAQALAVSPDGRQAVVCGQGGFDVVDLARRQVRPVRVEGDVRAAAIGPAGLLLVGGMRAGGRGFVERWRLDGAAPERVLPAEHDGVVLRMAISADGRRAVTCDVADQSKALLWDLQAESSPVGLFVEDRVTGVSFSADGAWVALVDRTEQRLRRFDVPGGNEVSKPLAHGQPIRGLAVSADGRTVLSAGGDTTLRSWQVDTGERVSLTHHTRSVECLRATPDGGWVGGDDTGSVVRWSLPAPGLPTLRFDGVLHRHPSRRLVCAVDVDAGGAVLSCGHDAAPWVLPAGAAEARPLPLGDAAVPPDQPLLDITRSAEGLVVIASLAGTRLVPRGQPAKVWRPEWRTQALAIAPDRRRALHIGGDDGVVRRLRLRRDDLEEDPGFELRHASPVLALAVHDDLGASAGGERGVDRTVRIWEEATGRELARVDVGPDADLPSRLAWAPDGRRLFVATTRGRVLVIDVPKP